MSMQGRWLIPALCAALIILSGCGIVENVLTMASCSDTPGVARAHCLEKKGVANNDPSYCSQIDALHGTEISDYTINWPGTVDLYVGMCYQGLALKNDNASLCEEIVKPVNNLTRDKCILQVALKTRDGKLCDLLRQYDERAACFKGVGQDPEKCELNWAVYDQEAGGCKCTVERMEWVDQYKICRCKSAYPVQTVISGSTPSCFTINEYIYNGGGPQGADPCGSLPDTPDRDRCIFATAKHTGQCHYILSGVSRMADCYLQVASSRTDCEAMSKLTTQNSADAAAVQERQEACFAKFK